MPTPGRVTSSNLKAHCAQVLQRVTRRKEAVIVTRHGRPIAKIVPIEQEPPQIFGFAKGCITIHGDLIASIDVEWDAAK